MKTRNIILVVAVLIALAGPAMSAGFKGDTIKEGVLTAGVPYWAPPYSFVDPQTGSLTGFDVDYLQLLAANLGLTLKLHTVDAASRIPVLLDGDVDLIAGALSKTRDLAKVIGLSDAYLASGQGFIAKGDSIRELRDLDGKKIGVLGGSFSEETLKKYVPGATPIAFEGPKDCLRALAEGRIDVVSGDSAILPVFHANMASAGFSIQAFTIAELPLSIGVRKDNKTLLTDLNQAVKKLEQSGEPQKLLQKWFRGMEEKKTGPAAQSAGAVIRRAATPPRVVVVVLRGTFSKGDEVSIFDLDGNFVSGGTVVSVFDDQVYVDVEKDKYHLVNSGFAVGSNVDMVLAKEAVKKHQDLLKSIQEEAKAEEAEIAAQVEKEAIAEEQRRIENQQKAYESELRRQEIRARSRAYEDHYRRGDYERYRYDD